MGDVVIDEITGLSKPDGLTMEHLMYTFNRALFPQRCEWGINLIIKKEKMKMFIRGLYGRIKFWFTLRKHFIEVYNEVFEWNHDFISGAKRRYSNVDALVTRSKAIESKIALLEKHLGIKIQHDSEREYYTKTKRKVKK